MTGLSLLISTLLLLEYYFVRVLWEQCFVCLFYMHTWCPWRQNWT